MMNDRRKENLLLSTLACILLILITACSSTAEVEEQASPVSISQLIDYDEDDRYQDYDETEIENIDLSKQSDDVNITKAGTYLLSETLKDGSILINVGSQDSIRLILKNATINSSDYAAIYASKAKKVILSLPKGTKNTISDGTSYQNLSDNEPSAAIFVKDDLTINGSGSLDVTANYNDAIISKDTLKVMEGTYQITSVDDGFVGRDGLLIHDGTLTINARGDGLKTTYDADTTKGDLFIENGIFTITSGNDGIQAEHALTIYDGTFTITSGGGSNNGSKSANAGQPGGFGMWDSSSQTEDTPTAKGIKAGTIVTIEKGTYSLDTSDDSLHSNGELHILDSLINILSGDDGIHANQTLIITKGTIEILKSYEGLEASVITINGGTIHVTADDDDGVNSAEDGSISGSLDIHGGTMIIIANGDGIDSNGNIHMDGGNIIVYGPTNDGDAALDYDGTFTINGGVLIACGPSGMAQAPSAVSEQNSIMIGRNSTVSENTMVYVADENGATILGVAPPKAYSNIVISSPNLKTASTYSLYSGGSTASAISNGYYTDGFTGGTLIASATISSSLTTVGNVAGTMEGGPGRGR